MHTEYFLQLKYADFENFSAQEKQKYLEKLELLLRYHSRKYYEENDPEISDSEFDQLFQFLKKIEKDCPELFLDSSSSVSHKIVGGISSEFQKSRHLVPMISLDNSFTPEDLKNWEGRFLRILNAKNNSVSSDDISFVVEPKFDGLGISCVYEKGKFVRAVTRGDGEEGENVTSNVLTLSEIPRYIEGVPDIFEIRGEIVMKRSDFNDLNTRLQEEGKKIFSNPRNAAAGSLRQLDSSLTAQRKLSVFFYETPLLQSQNQEEFPCYSDTLTFFDTKNIPHSRDYFFSSNINGVFDAIQKIKEMKEGFDFDIDGAVIKINNYTLRNTIGATGHHPRWAIAWKFPATQVTTQLLNVEWQVGRTGVLTPVAYLEPIDIDGVQVSRATLHNKDYILEKNLKLGDYVSLERSGEVIPKILFAHLAQRTGEEKKISIPEICPSCNEKVVQAEGEVAIRCVNKNCPEILKYSLFHFASKKSMNIRGLGKEVAEKMIETKCISSLVDLYFLEKKDLYLLDNFKEKSVENLYFAIQNSRGNDLWRLIHALGIPLVGVKTAKMLAKRIGKFSHIFSLSFEDLENIDDIGEKGAKSVLKYIYENEDMLKKFASLFDINHKEKTYEKTDIIFEGKTFVFTGTLQQFSRDEAGDLVEQYGGKVLSSVSQKLDFLVYGEKSGSKKIKAEDLNIPVLTESEFLGMLPKKGNEESNIPASLF